MSSLADAERAKRLRGVDSSLILEPGQKRQRGSPDLVDGKALPGTRARHGSVDPSVAANTPATDAAGLDEVRRKGLYMWEKLTSLGSVLDGDENPPHLEFMRLPSRLEWPDYYVQIKKPISFHEIRHKLDKAEYSTIAEVRSDFNQVFVNAKRYNAPGSAIFLNAKHLHKLVKTTYGVLTGDMGVPEEDDDAPEPPPPMSPVAMAVPTLQPKAQHVAAPLPGTTFAKRGPTLKPWLTKKLMETTDLRDASGRAYADGFRTLPDRKMWPQYYAVITHPMCFDTIQSKVVKRYYTSVKQFVDDVDVMLANALFFNEEASRIWKDARMLQTHFTEVMKEVPPVFVPPRKYNTAKRRAEQEALAAGLPLPPDPKKKKQQQRREMSGSAPPEGQSPAFDDGDSGDEYGDGGYSSGGHGQSVGAPTPQPYDLPPPAEQDPFALPTRSRSMTPSGLLPALPSYAMPTTASPTGSVPDLVHLYAVPAASAQAAFPQSPAYPNSPSNHLSPLPNGNGLHSPLAEPLQASPSEPAKPRLIAKLPRKGDVPAISRFLVRNTPATVPITLDNTVVRQHSFAVQASTERVDFTPFFRRTTASAANPGQATALLNSVIRISVRPSTTTFETLAELPSPDGPAHRYSLVPKPGLTVVEFTVTPRAGAAPGDNQTEVYRVFVTK